MPTREELKRFWEWCGGKLVNGHDYYYWLFQPHNRVERTASLELTLDNLFEYAVPKVRAVELKVVNLEKTGNLSGWYCSAQVQRKDNGELIHSGFHTDPALALYSALVKVMEEKGK